MCFQDCIDGFHYRREFLDITEPLLERSEHVERIRQLVCLAANLALTRFLGLTFRPQLIFLCLAQFARGFLCRRSLGFRLPAFRFARKIVQREEPLLWAWGKMSLAPI